MARVFARLQVNTADGKAFPFPKDADCRLAIVSIVGVRRRVRVECIHLYGSVIATVCPLRRLPQDVITTISLEIKRSIAISISDEVI